MARMQTFKPVYRSWTGPSAIVHLTRPEHIELIMNNSKNLDKGFGYNFLHPWLGTGLLTSKGNAGHSRSDRLKDQCRSIRQSERVWRKGSQTYIENEHNVWMYVLNTFLFYILLNTKHKSKQSAILAMLILHRLLRSINQDVLDSISETAMGSEINAQASSESDYVRAVYDISTLVLERMMRPWLWPSLIFGLTRDGKRHEENLKILHGFTRRVIEERKAARAAGGVREGNDLDENFGKKKRVAFLDLLLEASESSETPLTDEELREEVDTFMFEVRTEKTFHFRKTTRIRR
ncbi:cytochrome P450 4C1-like [Diaphorina citri]|uniref:Cytochrome P450 4C1-like n=1 Tax=Diaphorina citri TaxID=121845 RepID=A0A3Q0J166_DIACI|nr:cytochrome P450 4C1-like [Diaphorina citri]